jgi:hypothetical protein
LLHLLFDLPVFQNQWHIWRHMAFASPAEDEDDLLHMQAAFMASQGMPSATVRPFRLASPCFLTALKTAASQAEEG